MDESSVIIDTEQCIENEADDRNNESPTTDASCNGLLQEPTPISSTSNRSDRTSSGLLA
jgi:hypothetical protein